MNSPWILVVFFVCFLLSCSMGEGPTPAILTLDAAINESGKDTVESVVRFPNRFSTRDGCPCYSHRLENDFFSPPFRLPSCFFFLSISLIYFPSPPSLCRHRPFLLLRPSSSYLFILITYALLLAAFLISLRQLYSESLRNKKFVSVHTFKAPFMRFFFPKGRTRPLNS